MLAIPFQRVPSAFSFVSESRQELRMTLQQHTGTGRSSTEAFWEAREIRRL